MVQRYDLHDVGECNMCHAPTADARLLGRRLNAHQGVRPTRGVGVACSVVRCRSCGLVFANPQVLPHGLAQHYDTAPESYWEPGYFVDHDGYFADQIEVFRSLWTGSGVAAALDIGAGIGKAMRALQAHGLDAYGLEPSATFRDLALSRGGIAPDRLKLSSVEAAEYPAGSFDLVTFGAVLEHLADPAAALDDALRWVRPGGLVHAEVPSADWLTSQLVNAVYRVQGLDYVTNLSPMHPPYHLYEFTPRSFEAHAQRGGHEVALLRTHTGRDTFLPGPDRLWRALMERTRRGMLLEVWLRR